MSFDDEDVSMDPSTARRLLAEELDRLRRIQQARPTAAPDPVTGVQADITVPDRHIADSASEAFEQDKEVSIAEHAEAGLAEVEAALRRLDDGTYGRCEVCGKPIADERLEAVPATRFCLEDQAEQERRAGPSGEGS
ncbi:MAG: TraR/DksA C4-type zinc finger protein [Actinomycetota bacterium]|nr:TraR/DksA C4-type zinc finger protein [Actinomycetota bacterium]